MMQRTRLINILSLLTVVAVVLVADDVLAQQTQLETKFSNTLALVLRMAKALCAALGTLGIYRAAKKYYDGDGMAGTTLAAVVFGLFLFIAAPWIVEAMVQTAG